MNRGYHAPGSKLLPEIDDFLWSSETYARNPGEVPLGEI